MFGPSKPKVVAEHEAKDNIERVYHEIRQTLRVSGINLNFRTWAGYKKFFPAMWAGMRSNVETRAFEKAADDVRAAAVRAAETLGKLGAAASVRLGESQTYQIRAALDLYHYINPKLLLFTSAVRMALDGETVGGSAANQTVELIERGIPAKMYPLEMVSDEPEDRRIRGLFDDIKGTLSLSAINSDYRTLALWPDYLERAWERLKPITQQDKYRNASDSLRELARSLARDLPYPVRLSLERVKELGEDADDVLKTTEKFERLLPSLILNISLFELDWQTSDLLSRSPFPAKSRQPLAGRVGGVI